MFDKSVFVRNIKKFRNERGLTQKDIYETMKCSQAAYSNYENGNSSRIPTIENLVNLSEEYNISIDELFGINRKKEETQADILLNLCDMYKKIPFRIEEVEVPVDIEWGEVPSFDEYGRVISRIIPKKRHAIYFDSSRYEEALKNMGAILSIDEYETRLDMLSLWEKSLKESKYNRFPANDALFCEEFPF